MRKDVDECKPGSVVCYSFSLSISAWELRRHKVGLDGDLFFVIPLACLCGIKTRLVDLILLPLQRGPSTVDRSFVEGVGENEEWRG